MVKITRVIILLIFAFITTVCAVPNPTLLGGKGLSGLFKGKSGCHKPKEPEHCDGGGGGGSRASAVAISSAESDGGRGRASAKSVAVAQSDSRSNDDDWDD